MKILIVDDEKSIRFALKDIIEFEGHEVALAADGKEGLEMALANSYDVIFSDIKMPVMDGVEMLERIVDFSLKLYFCFFTFCFSYFC